MFTRSSSNGTIRFLSNRLIAPLLPVLACALLAGLAFGSARTAQAQAIEQSETEAALETAASAPANALGITAAPWRAHFGEQAAEVLRGRSPTARQAAMRDLIAVAKTGQRGIDLSDAIAPLLQVANDGSSEGRRIMALQALEAIGPEHSSELLYEQAVKQLRSTVEAEPSERVRRVARTVINDFYAEESK